MSEFDAIVVGSGMTGGWAAKELCERGLKVLLLERGPPIDPAVDYSDMLAPWQTKHLDMINEDEMHRVFPTFERGALAVYALHESNKQFWTGDDEQPYETPPGKVYDWTRGYHLGGRSIMWGRQTYRWCEQDFENNKRDGRGVDWPIRYADLAPWYDHVEKFAGISGTAEGLAEVPDGQFQPGFALNRVEKVAKERIEAAFPTRKVIGGRCAHLTRPTEEQIELGRAQCQARSVCHHGCAYRAYFSSLNATLPAAQKTGNLTVVTNAIVDSLDYDPKSQRVSAVRVLDAVTRAGRTYRARLVVLCASAIPSAMILLNSVSESFPNGLANRSDQVGRNLMDYVVGGGANGTLPGFLDRYYKGRRPTGIYIPRYANLTEHDKPYLRGFGFQGGAHRPGLQPDRAGVGAALKAANRVPGPWTLALGAWGEALSDPNNRVTLHRTRTDKWGMRIPFIEADWGENERVMMREAMKDAVAMLKAAGCVDIQPLWKDELSRPGSAVQEMGTARMGRDPATSVLNGWNQAHDVPNLFITDGACMASSGSRPGNSLTFMALTARAANHAAELLREGKL